MNHIKSYFILSLCGAASVFSFDAAAATGVTEAPATVQAVGVIASEEPSLPVPPQRPSESASPTPTPTPSHAVTEAPDPGATPVPVQTVIASCCEDAQKAEDECKKQAVAMAHAYATAIAQYPTEPDEEGNPPPPPPPPPSPETYCASVFCQAMGQCLNGVPPGLSAPESCMYGISGFLAIESDCKLMVRASDSVSSKDNSSSKPSYPAEVQKGWDACMEYHKNPPTPTTTPEPTHSTVPANPTPTSTPFVEGPRLDPPTGPARGGTVEGVIPVERE